MPNSTEVVTSLKQSIVAFDKKRAEIITKAYAEGGAERVNQVIDEYNALRDASFELTRRQLNANHAAYENLLKVCYAETTELTNSINQLKQTGEILNAAAKVVNLVGRILIILGL